MKIMIQYLIVPLILSGCIEAISIKERLIRIIMPQQFSGCSAAMTLDAIPRWNKLKQNELNDNLIEVAREGNSLRIKQLLKWGADVTARNDVYDGRALDWAASRGHLDCLKLLIEAKSDVNGRNKEGRTALHSATKHGRTDCVKFLAKVGTDINATTEEGYTALHIAATNGHLDCLKALIQEKAKLNIGDSIGFTALHWAAFYGEIDCLKALIEAKTELNISSHDGLTPLHLAFITENIDCYHLLAGKAAFNTSNEQGDTLFYTAAA